MAARRERLQAIGGLRGVAAMHIMLFHMGSNGLLDRVPLPLGLRQLFDFGSVMTGMFIALSGFLLYYSYAGNESTLRVPAREFWLARLARIFPIMIIGHLLFVPISLFGTNAYSFQEALVRGGLVITATQAWLPSMAFSYNVPAWTISALIFCYAIFPAVVRATGRLSQRQLVAALVICWLLGMLPSVAYLAINPAEITATSTDQANAWSMFLHTFPVVWLPAFLSGVFLAALFVNHGWARLVNGPLLIVGGCAGLLVAVAISPWVPYYLAHNGLFAPLQYMLMVGLACDRGAIARVLSSAPMNALGAASLALYILHYPPLRYLAYATKRGWLADHATIYAIAYVAVTVWFSVLATNHIVEPFARWVRGMTKRRTTFATTTDSAGAGTTATAAP